MSAPLCSVASELRIQKSAKRGQIHCFIESVLAKWAIFVKYYRFWVSKYALFHQNMCDYFIYSTSQKFGHTYSFHGFTLFLLFSTL